MGWELFGASSEACAHHAGHSCPCMSCMLCCAGGTHDYGLAVHVYYINEAAEALRISPADIYGSTEADFGINISRAAQPLQGIEVCMLRQRCSFALYCKCYVTRKQLRAGRIETTCIRVPAWSGCPACFLAALCYAATCRCIVFQRITVEVISCN